MGTRIHPAKSNPIARLATAARDCDAVDMSGALLFAASRAISVNPHRFRSKQHTIAGNFNAYTSINILCLQRRIETVYRISILI